MNFTFCLKRNQLSEVFLNSKIFFFNNFVSNNFWKITEKFDFFVEKNYQLWKMVNRVTLPQSNYNPGRLYKFP